MKGKLTQKRLKELLRYNPGKGLFTWCKDRGGTARAGVVAGTEDGDGYVKISVDNKLYFAHRLAWYYVHGKFPDNQIDHVNGIRNDNRIENLRDVTNKENTSFLLARKNSSDAYPLGKTGVKGVCVHRKKCRNGKVYVRYRAKIKEKGKLKMKCFPFTPDGLKQAGEWYKAEHGRIYKELLPNN